LINQLAPNHFDKKIIEVLLGHQVEELKTENDDTQGIFHCIITGSFNSLPGGHLQRTEGLRERGG